MHVWWHACTTPDTCILNTHEHFVTQERMFTHVCKHTSTCVCVMLHLSSIISYMYGTRSAKIYFQKQPVFFINKVIGKLLVIQYTKSAHIVVIGLLFLTN